MLRLLNKDDLKMKEAINISVTRESCFNNSIETVLNRHLSLFSLDLRLIIMKLKRNPPWWILFTTISLVSCFRYAFLFSK